MPLQNSLTIVNTQISANTYELSHYLITALSNKILRSHFYVRRSMSMLQETIPRMQKKRHFLLLENKVIFLSLRQSLKQAHISKKITILKCHHIANLVNKPQLLTLAHKHQTIIFNCARKKLQTKNRNIKGRVSVRIHLTNTAEYQKDNQWKYRLIAHNYSHVTHDAGQVIIINTSQ